MTCETASIGGSSWTEVSSTRSNFEVGSTCTSFVEVSEKDCWYGVDTFSDVSSVHQLESDRNSSIAVAKTRSRSKALAAISEDPTCDSEEVVGKSNKRFDSARFWKSKNAASTTIFGQNVEVQIRRPNGNEVSEMDMMVNSPTLANSININKHNGWKVEKLLDELCVGVLKTSSRDRLIYELPVVGHIKGMASTVSEKVVTKPRGGPVELVVQMPQYNSTEICYSVIRRFDHHPRQVPESISDNVEELRFAKLTAPRGFDEDSIGQTRPTQAWCRNGDGFFAHRFTAANKEQFLEMNFGQPTVVTHVTVSGIQFELRPVDGGKPDSLEVICPTHFSSRGYSDESIYYYEQFELYARPQHNGSWMKLGKFRGPNSNFHERVVDLREVASNVPTSGLTCYALRFVPVLPEQLATLKQSYHYRSLPHWRRNRLSPKVLHEMYLTVLSERGMCVSAFGHTKGPTLGSAEVETLIGSLDGKGYHSYHSRRMHENLRQDVVTYHVVNTNPTPWKRTSGRSRNAKEVGKNRSKKMHNLINDAYKEYLESLEDSFDSEDEEWFYNDSTTATVEPHVPSGKSVKIEKTENLFQAIDKDDLQTVRDLIAYDKSLLKSRVQSRTPLYSALLQRREEIALFLMTKGKTTLLEDREFFACFHAASDEMKRALANARPKREDKKKKKKTTNNRRPSSAKVTQRAQSRAELVRRHGEIGAFVRACKVGNLECAKAIVQSNRKVLSDRFYCRSPLFYALNHGQAQVAEYLLHLCPSVFEDADEYIRCWNSAKNDEMRKLMETHSYAKHVRQQQRQ